MKLLENAFHAKFLIADIVIEDLIHVLNAKKDGNFLAREKIKNVFKVESRVPNMYTRLISLAIQTSLEKVLKS